MVLLIVFYFVFHFILFVRSCNSPPFSPFLCHSLLL